MKKTSDLTSQSDAMLQASVAELRDRVRALRFAIANRQLKSLHEVRATRRAVARALTELTARRKSAK
jgi:ribosomal protein L29